MTFQEAYNRTRRILNICVSSASVYELPRLLNYVTAPNVMIWSAVAASCSVPLVFSATQLLVKNPITGENSPWNPTPQHWIDGSVDNDLPMTRLAEMFNVNHFIVSQVNPHVVPFLVKDEQSIVKNVQSGSAGPGFVYTLTNLAKDEALHRMQIMAELGIFPNLVTKAKSILSQKYSGDITILPAIDYKDFPRMLKNPTSDFMIQAMLCGERATWPKLSRIRNHCAVELELDAAVQTLRTRVVFSPSQVDLRRMSTGNTFTKRMGRRRGDSGGNVLRSTGDEEEGFHARKSFSRPPLRTANTQLNLSRKYMGPAKPWSRSVHATPLPTPQIIDARPTKNPLDLHLQLLDVSSAGETTHSPPSSDADIDSHTDESSPEPDAAEVPGLGLYHSPNSQTHQVPEVIDFFSASQPVTSGTDHVLATSPLSARSTGGFTTSPISMTRRSGDFGKTVGANSPEMRYKRLFHPQPQAKPQENPEALQ
jgi:TAG lipase/steryl ester hydrolase/phospholipase A2/LPA acyltransferase